jgi:hypothetical protein
MNKIKIITHIKENYPDAHILLADGFENAFLGIGQQFNTFFSVYDKNKCIKILTKNMSYEEAIEYFEYNVLGAYVGENTPIFIDNFDSY